MQIPRYTTPLRTAEQWPRHKAKARQRKITRNHTAKTAQAAIDHAAERRL